MKIKTLFSALFLLIALTLAGCGGNVAQSSGTDNIQLVKTRVSAWTEDINSRNEDVMSHYSMEYLQDGVSYDSERFNWAFLFSMEDELRLRIEEPYFPSITIVDGDASVTMHYRLTISIFDNGIWTDETTDEVLEIVLRRESGRWLLYGNQEGPTTPQIQTT